METIPKTCILYLRVAAGADAAAAAAQKEAVTRHATSFRLHGHRDLFR
jgi:hypothetical protein